MTPTPSAWTPDLVARHPQSASNMIGKLTADLVELEVERAESFRLGMAAGREAIEYALALNEANDRADRAEAALKRVTELHRRADSTCECGEDHGPSCVLCWASGDESWPCETMRAVTEATR